MMISAVSMFWHSAATSQSLQSCFMAATH